MVHVVFLHPDLGIGGAERATIDAALALKSRGHTVEFVTSHHNPKHCFPETTDGSLRVTVAGDWLPRSLLGKCFALCAYIRMLYAAMYLVFFSGISFDVVFCDQISACIPVLKISPARIIFYCHFPDMLLTQRKTLLKKLYRKPIDILEEKTTGMADCVLINSHFTGMVFKQTFTSLTHIQPQVLYPIPDFTSLDKPVELVSEKLIPKGKNVVFVSINRYERKKNLPLALKSLAFLKENHGVDLSTVHLVMAGGYDERVQENKEHFAELTQLSEELGIAEHVTFVRSFSDAEKRSLLHCSTCLLYTPDREHFGIVPVEAMYKECPVIAVKSGGPLETVEHGVTGFLCPQTDSDFADNMLKFVRDRGLSKKMGEAGRKRVIDKFSFVAFSDQLDSIVHSLVKGEKKKDFKLLLMALFVLPVFVFLALVAIF